MPILRNVVSLFDGISCGQLALKDAGIEVENYYASEIEKTAIQIAMKNFPSTIQLGDVTKWRNWDIDWSKVDLLIGGSPCQGFSFAGKQLNFDDPRSSLFFCFVDILEHIKKVNPNVKFLLENVKMKKEFQDVITGFLGVSPVLIDSALVSAQTRKRLYWANWMFEQPEDRGILLKDVLEKEVDKKYYYSEKAISYLDRSKINKRFANYSDDYKSKCLVAVFSKSLPYNVYVDRPKSLCITSNYSQMACINYNKSQGQIIFDNNTIRRLTPVECERLQTMPDNYTEGVSVSIKSNKTKSIISNTILETGSQIHIGLTENLTNVACNISGTEIL